MIAIKPLYLLFCEGSLGLRGSHPLDERGRWRFILENVETGHRTEASDTESIGHPDRTSLLAVLRGLEALEQPSRVTLVTTNRYVARGLQYGLSEWRENDYCWEHFGSVQPVRNSDLWRRIDRALAYHEVQCRWMAQDVDANHEAGDVRSVLLATSGSMASVADSDAIRETGESSVQTAPKVGVQWMQGRSVATISKEPVRAFSRPSQLALLEKCQTDSCSGAEFSDADVGPSAGLIERLEEDLILPISEPWRTGRGVEMSREDDRNHDYFGVEGDRAGDRDSARESDRDIDSLERELVLPISNATVDTEVGLGSYGTDRQTGLPAETKVPNLIDHKDRSWHSRFLVRSLWGIVLGFDSFLFSCLQCMFLLDPRREEFRSRRP